MATVQPFAPSGATVKISGTTTSASATISGFNGPNNSGSLLVTNPSSVLVFVTFGKTAPTASATSLPIPAGGTRILGVGGCNYVAAITATSTGDVYFTPGDGGI